MYTSMYTKKGGIKGKIVNAEEHFKQLMTAFFQLFPADTGFQVNSRE